MYDSMSDYTKHSYIIKYKSKIACDVRLFVLLTLYKSWSNTADTSDDNDIWSNTADTSDDNDIWSNTADTSDNTWSNTADTSDDNDIWSNTANTSDNNNIWSMESFCVTPKRVCILDSGGDWINEQMLKCKKP
jgi:hypothetical protein